MDKGIQADEDEADLYDFVETPWGRRRVIMM